MADGKIRHHNHIIEEKAYRILQNILPIEWVQRTMSPDYGIDIDLELFDYENEKCVTLGEHVFLQVKGTETSKFGEIKPMGKQIYTEKELVEMQVPVLKFSIDVPLLKLVERMGSAIPVLLTVVDIKTENAYYVCLNDYIRHILFYYNTDYRNQDYITIYIPTKNILTPEVISWYGKRAKLYGLFQELLTLADNVQYMNAEHRISMVERQLDMIASSDAWSACRQWPLLDYLHNQLLEMLDNDLVNSVGKVMLTRYEEEGKDPKTYTICFDDEVVPISVHTAAKVISCDTFLDRAKALSASYENDIRHIDLPTQLNWMLSH